MWLLPWKYFPNFFPKFWFELGFLFSLFFSKIVISSFFHALWLRLITWCILNNNSFQIRWHFLLQYIFFTGDRAVSPCQSLMRSDPFPKYRLPVSKFSSFKKITSCLAFFYSNRAAIHFKVRGCQIQKLKPSSQMLFPAKSCKIRVLFCHLDTNKGDVLDCLRIVITL